MFLHPENQHILWQTLQKSPYLVEFTQKFAGYREEWFRNIIEQFYTQWISKNGRIPTNAHELLELNKNAIQMMVAELKRLVGYSGITPGHTQTAGVYIPSYNVAEERKKREDAWSENYSRYQVEYNQLLVRPTVPLGELPSEFADTKIKNMDELVREHAKFRDIELQQYLPQKPIKQLRQQQQQQQPPAPPKLKIMGEIAKVDEIINEISLPSEITSSQSQDDLKADIITLHSNDDKSSPSERNVANDKRVRWSETIEHEIENINYMEDVEVFDVSDG
jgi:hypothetical protein